MKYFIFFLFLLIFSTKNSYAQMASFNCIQKQTFYTYQFFINLDNMTMKLGPFSPYKITQINDDKIYSASHSDGYLRYMTFERYSGEVTYSIIYKDTKKIYKTETYKCTKSSKVF